MQKPVFVAALGMAILLSTGCGSSVTTAPQTTPIANPEVSTGDPTSGYGVQDTYTSSPATPSATATASAPSSHGSVQSSKPTARRAPVTTRPANPQVLPTAPSVATLPGASLERVYTYSVSSAGTVTNDMTAFASAVARIYADPHGWADGGRVQFRRVSSGGDFTVTLASPARVHEYAPSVCDTVYSCTAGRNVVINEARWLGGPVNYVWPEDLESYRTMVVNHETGHWLGFGHRFCAGPGQTAPVMQQQSISLQGCRPNPWPTAAELAVKRGG